MIVEPLGSQLDGERVRNAGRLLQLGALVLEPDLDLRLVQSELVGEPAPSVLGQVAVGVELAAQQRQLVGVERRPRSLVVAAG